ncbi:19435_t:CDS:2, partial [Funneliformis geosporum]
NPFPKRILRCCNILCRFFKTSHMGGFLLRKYIEEMNISGGSLKTYCETRWTSCYDTVKSVARLQEPLEKIKRENYEIITNQNLKKIFNSRCFFNDCNRIAMILEPLRNTILLLERNSTTLADCFIMLIRLAVKINQIPHEIGTIGFKNHCIQAINERWEKSFDDEPYMLAYWLHPAYRGIGLSNTLQSRIIKYAGKLIYDMGYKDKAAIKTLIANMANFKCLEGAYSLEYNEEFNSPRTWWHVTTAESMSKIRHYYLNNSRHELQYVGKTLTNEEISKLIQETSLIDNEELADDDNDLNMEINEEIPQNEVYVLIIAKHIDLTNPVFDEEAESSKSDESEHNIESDEDDNFNIDEMIDNFL